MTVDEMKAFVSAHFESLINRGDLTTIERNVRKDYVDHNGPGGQRSSLDKIRDRTASNLRRFQSLRVELRDILADGDKVVVRNVWTAYDSDSGENIEMHGFVLFRLQDDKLAERWATITDPAPLNADRLEW